MLRKGKGRSSRTGLCPSSERRQLATSALLAAENGILEVVAPRAAHRPYGLTWCKSDTDSIRVGGHRKGSVRAGQGRADPRLQPRRQLVATALAPDDVLEPGPELLPVQAIPALVQVLLDRVASLLRHLVIEVPLQEVQDLAAVNL